MKNVKVIKKIVQVNTKFVQTLSQSQMSYFANKWVNIPALFVALVKKIKRGIKKNHIYLDFKSAFMIICKVLSNKTKIKMLKNLFKFSHLIKLMIKNCSKYVVDNTAYQHYRLGIFDFPLPGRKGNY